MAVNLFLARVWKLSFQMLAVCQLSVIMLVYPMLHFKMHCYLIYTFAGFQEIKILLNVYPIVPFCNGSAVCRASLVETWFVFGDRSSK